MKSFPKSVALELMRRETASYYHHVISMKSIIKPTNHTRPSPLTKDRLILIRYSVATLPCFSYGLGLSIFPISSYISLTN